MACHFLKFVISRCGLQAGASLKAQGDDLRLGRRLSPKLLHVHCVGHFDLNFNLLTALVKDIILLRERVPQPLTVTGYLVFRVQHRPDQLFFGHPFPVIA